ncbi:MAG: hypothetical protein EB053_06230, partial [Chlamydiae bacterium]|nr:hypothetical protein [Chlamydiota bacterium]
YVAATLERLGFVKKEFKLVFYGPNWLKSLADESQNGKKFSQMRPGVNSSYVTCEDSQEKLMNALVLAGSLS